MDTVVVGRDMLPEARYFVAHEVILRAVVLLKRNKYTSPLVGVPVGFDTMNALAGVVSRPMV